jgi:GDP-L-fucose synthase
MAMSKSSAANATLEPGRILVTGSTGFIGRNLLRYLDSNGFEVLGVGSQEGDLRSWENWVSLMENIQPNTLIHLAARSGGIKGNIRSPFDYFYDNLMILAQLTKVIQNYRLQQVIIPIGGCSYPDHAKGKFSERDLWTGFPHLASAPFSTARLMSTLLPIVFQESSTRIKVLIPGNAYGPFDNFNLQESHVVPGMIRKVYEARKYNKSEVVFWGTGNPVRDFVYVDDISKNIARVIQLNQNFSGLNISSGIGTRLSNLGKIICEKMNFQGTIVWNSTEPEGQMEKVFETDFAKSLGLDCLTSLEEGLSRTVNWFESNIETGEVRT